MFEAARRFLQSVGFREVDRRTIKFGWQGNVEFRLRKNDTTGDQYALLAVGVETAIRLNATELASIIKAAKDIHDQMD